MSAVECIVDCQNTLGEGPAWSVDEQKLFWIDIDKSELWRYDPETGDTKVWKTPERVASFAFREEGGLIVAFESGLAFYDPENVMGDVLNLLTYWKWGLDLGQIGCDLKRKKGRG